MVGCDRSSYAGSGRWVWVVEYASGLRFEFAAARSFLRGTRFFDHSSDFEPLAVEVCLINGSAWFYKAMFYALSGRYPVFCGLQSH